MTTAMTSNASSTCIVLALVGSRRDCQRALTLSVNSRRYECFSATAKSAVLLTMTVDMTCEMHVNAFQCNVRLT